MFKNMCVKRVEGLTSEECFEFKDLYKNNQMQIAETTAKLHDLLERKEYYQNRLIDQMDDCPKPSPVGSLN